MSIQHIIQDAGVAINHYEPVHGGDINRAYCLHGDGGKYFLKVNEAKLYPRMFDKEADGLDALRQNCRLTVSRVIKSGITQHDQWLMLEWMEKGVPEKDCWQNFGSGLAMLHRQPQALFGWADDNFIGSLVQCNQQRPYWHLFYAECRVMPLVKTLFNGGALSPKDIAAAELLCKNLEQLFPAEPPALLHGDLWGGNFVISATGYATIFDPAVYCGHREMDIGMANLFGGFDRRFFEAYNETYPLQKGWQQRLPLTQLYPLLVHAVLFGGHYVEQAKGIIKQVGG